MTGFSAVREQVSLNWGEKLKLLSWFHAGYAQPLYYHNDSQQFYVLFSRSIEIRGAHGERIASETRVYPS